MISSTKMSQMNRKQHSDALNNLAMIANWGGKAREGRTLALRAIDLDPDNVDAYYQAGLGILDAGEDVEEALVYFTKSISIDNGAYYVYAALGEAYAKLGRNAEARESFLLAIEGGDVWTRSVAHFRFGEMLEKENQLRAAIEQYQQTIKLDPQFYNAQKRIDELLRFHPDLVDISIDAQ